MNYPKITIFSDYICPFCYIGKDRAEKLERDFKGIEIEWKMIEIHPEIPRTGVPRDQLKGEYMDDVWTNVKLLSDEANLDVKIPKILANSRLAFIASEYAREHGKYDEFHEAVMDAYWKHELNIGEFTVLKTIGENLGLDFSDFREYVATSNWEEKLQANMELARDNNVMAVPSFVIGDSEKVIAGAVPYNKIKKVIEQEIK